MAVKCFLMFFLFWFHPSFTCLDTLFNIYIYIYIFFFLPACWVVGGILIRKRGALTPRHSLFQKLHLKYTRSLVKCRKTQSAQGYLHARLNQSSFFFSIKSPLLGRCVNKRVQQISIQISPISVIFSLASNNFLTYSEKKLSLNEKKEKKLLNRTCIKRHRIKRLPCDKGWVFNAPKFSSLLFNTKYTILAKVDVHHISNCVSHDMQIFFVYFIFRGFLAISGEKGRKALLREIELLKLFGREGHENVVKFIGCVTVGAQPILIMEYLWRGDLLGYLRKSRGVFDQYHHGVGRVDHLTTYDMVLFAKQIAHGMTFLASRGSCHFFFRFQIIHRDLAARNILLLDEHRVCKLTDFGLSYQDFKYGPGNAKRGCIPIKWTAPEILFGHVEQLSTKSDVWSYGIVLYEIFTVGGIPYEGWSQSTTMKKIEEGYRLPKPEHIDDSLYAVMLNCWKYESASRPHFVKLYQTMDTYIKTKTYVDIFDDDKYDQDKYNFVDDRGAVANPEDAGADELGAAAANPIGNLAREVGKHGAAAHPFVVAIDDGATAFPFAINLQDKGAAAGNLAHEVGKHGAAAHPFVVAIDDGATAFPFAINLQDKGAAAGNLACEVGKYSATAHPSMAGIDDGATAFPLGIKVEEGGCAAYPFESDKKDMDAQAYLLESDTLPYLSESEEEDVDDSECPLAIDEEEIDDSKCPFAIEEEEIDPLPSSLVMDENGLAASACPLVTDEENSDSLACPLVVEEEDSNNSACSPVPGEEDLEASGCLSVTEKEDPTSFARSANEVNKPDASPFPCVIEEDLDSLEYNPLIEKEGLSDSVFPPEIQTDDEEGVTSEPENTVGYEGAVAVQSEKEAVEEEPKTCQLEYTKDKQDDLGNYMDDQSDAVDFLDGKASVQEYDGNQLTAADTDETGSDEDEESSEATPLVQD
ncbi:unnamed protein product [Pocillopora meandrina]|uniref:Protein kinase domain-containing protein n=1 Tax=Pocillopora meandrina TaxID=46732 RepID=A0AAU9Y4W2_9CNID|nr:unnamed protein product [Pocillopora meandrina]